MNESRESVDVYKTSLKMSGLSIVTAVAFDEICYHRRYESSNNKETFWLFDNDTLTNSEENEK